MVGARQPSGLNYRQLPTAGYPIDLNMMRVEPAGVISCCGINAIIRVSCTKSNNRLVCPCGRCAPKSNKISF